MPRDTDNSGSTSLPQHFVAPEPPRVAFRCHPHRVQAFPGSGPGVGEYATLEDWPVGSGSATFCQLATANMRARALLHCGLVGPCLSGVWPRPPTHPAKLRVCSGHVTMYSERLHSAIHRGRASLWWLVRSVSNPATPCLAPRIQATTSLCSGRGVRHASPVALSRRPLLEQTLSILPQPNHGYAESSRGRELKVAITWIRDAR